MTRKKPKHPPSICRLIGFRLGTYIDVLQIHRLDRQTPGEEIMRALNDVINSGKVRYIGASSVMLLISPLILPLTAYRWQRGSSSVLITSPRNMDGINSSVSPQSHLRSPLLQLFQLHLSCMQNYHNLLYREEEREMIPYCQSARIGLIPWSPLAQGILTRPWDSKPSSIRGQNNPYLALIISESDKVVVDRLEEVAKRLGTSMATVATAWSLKKGMNPILGLQSVERIDEAVRMAAFKLSDEDANLLEEPYRPKPLAPIF
jgi:aryl-alcohol dehydrogenase-like predicted oxidoreductase